MRKNLINVKSVQNHLFSYDLKQRTTLHTGDRPHKCHVCHKSFRKSASLKAHLQIHSEDRPFVCPHCQKSFKQKACLNTHLRIHKGVRSYKCEICPKSFIGSGDLKRHSVIHTGDRPYKCEVCHKSFTQSASLKVHLRIHSEDRPFVCPHCQKAFKQKPGLNGHLLIHKGVKSYKCEICPKSFINRSVLDRHLLTHTGEKPHVCPECQKGFSQKDTLKQHLYLHTGQQPFKCEKCPKAFANASNLKIHCLIHDRENPYISPEYETKLLQKISLNHYILTHTGNKLYTYDESDRIDPISKSDNTNEKQYFSDACQETSKNKVPAHFETKPYVKNVCEDNLVEKADLNYHVFINSKEITQDSDTRQVPFTNNLILTSNNTGKKLYFADVCKNVSSNEVNVDSPVYFIEKPYVCNVCLERFVQKVDLNNHFLIHSEEIQDSGVSQISSSSGITVWSFNSSGEQLYFSNMCKKVTTNKTTTENPVNFEKKPFVKNVCPEQFVQVIDQNNDVLTQSETIIQGNNLSQVSSTNEVISTPNNTGEKLHFFNVCKKGSTNADTAKNLANFEKKMYLENEYPEQFVEIIDLNNDILIQSEVINQEINVSQVPSTNELQKVDLYNHIQIHSEQITQETGVSRAVNKKTKHLHSQKSLTPSRSLSIPFEVHSGEKPFICPHCQKAFSQKANLRKHLLIHNKEKSHKCEICSKCFIGAYNLKLHTYTHTEDRPHKCEVCHKSFTRAHCLKQHSVIHTGVRPYKCEICDKSFTQSVCLKVHLRIHSGDRPFVCPHCQKAFKQKPGLNSHLLIHKGERSHKCKLCPKSFMFSHLLKRHLLTHTGEKPHVCPECQKGFSQKHTLKEHLYIHTGNHPYKCDKCPKSFANSSGLKLHCLKHASDKSHLLLDQQEQFSQKVNLKHDLFIHTEKEQYTHDLVHKIEEPYKCEKCSKSFANSSGLKLHCLKHASEKCHLLLDQQEQFLQKVNLKHDLFILTEKEQYTHDLVHEIEEPYKCEKCSKSYVHLEELNEHLVTHKKSLSQHLFIDTEEKQHTTDIINTIKRPYKCGECSKSFVTLTDFTIHLSNHSEI